MTETWRLYKARIRKLKMWYYLTNKLTKVPFWRVVRDAIFDGDEAFGLVDDWLFCIHMGDMPYGTAKARTGDPGAWIMFQHEQMDDSDFTDQYGTEWPDIDQFYDLAS